MTIKTAGGLALIAMVTLGLQPANAPGTTFPGLLALVGVDAASAAPGRRMGGGGGGIARPQGGGRNLSRPGGNGGGIRGGSVNNINHNNINNNNVNVNVNRNVNVQGGGYGYGHYDHYDHWDDHWHPVAAAAAVTATAIVVGSMVRSIPPSCTTVIVNGASYSQCGSTWYQPSYVGSSVQYIVVNPPR